MRKLFRIIKHWGGRSVSFAMGVLGLLYIWPDIQGLPSAYGFKWGQIMPDRETVAYILLMLALLWIIWIDIRPAVLSQRRLFGLVRVGLFEVAELVMYPSNDQVGIRLSFFIENQSPTDPIYFRIGRVQVSIDGMINQDEELGLIEGRIAPSSNQRVMLAGIKWFDRKEIYNGRDDIEIHYGSKASRLPYILHHRGMVTMHFNFPAERSGRARFNISTHHLTAEHTSN